MLHTSSSVSGEDRNESRGKVGDRHTQYTNTNHNTQYKRHKTQHKHTHVSIRYVYVVCGMCCVYSVCGVHSGVHSVVCSMVRSVCAYGTVVASVPSRLLPLTKRKRGRRQKLHLQLPIS
jgi:hypothetical protein